MVEDNRTEEALWYLAEMMVPLGDINYRAVAEARAELKKRFLFFGPVDPTKKPFVKDEKW